MTTFDNTLNADGALIVGAGLAGLFTALKLAPRPVTVLSTAHTPMPSIRKWPGRASSITARPKA